MATDPSLPAEPHGGVGRPLEMSAARPADIPAARRAATAHLRAAGCPNTELALLVLSELVTNAVLHAGGANRIVVTCSTGWIHIAVHDRQPGEVHPRGVAPTIDGRGLRIVDKSAEDWGSRPVDGGKAVWALVRPDPTPPAETIG